MLTTTQQRGVDTRGAIVAAISDLTSRLGYSPTMREVGEAVGIGTSTVHWHLDVLEKEGKVKRDSRVPRSLRVVSG